MKKLIFLFVFITSILSVSSQTYYKEGTAQLLAYKIGNTSWVYFKVKETNTYHKIRFDECRYPKVQLGAFIKIHYTVSKRKVIIAYVKVHDYTRECSRHDVDGIYTMQNIEKY